MPPAPKIATLPADTLAELHSRLRASGYSQSVAIAEWLSGLGFPIGKSAVNAYAQELRRLDAVAGDANAAILQRRKKTKVASASRSELLAELGALRIREHQLIRQLEAIEEASG